MNRTQPYLFIGMHMPDLDVDAFATLCSRER